MAQLKDLSRVYGTLYANTGFTVENGGTTYITLDSTGIDPSTNAIAASLGTTTQRWILFANTITAGGLATLSAGLTVTGTANASTSMFVGANVSMTTTSFSAGNTVQAFVANNINILLSMSVPGTPTMGTSTTGGTLAAATYYYRITAIDARGVESLGSVQASIITTGTTSTTTLTFAPAPGAVSYRVYRSTTSGTYTAGYISAPISSLTVSGANYIFTDTGSALTVATLPTTSLSRAFYANNTAGANNNFGSVFVQANGAVGISTTAPDASFVVAGTANISANVWIGGSATVAGNLTVSGTTTYINTTNLNVGDNIVTLNSDLGAVAPSENAGIEVNRGTSANVAILWDETIDRWTATNDGTTYANIAIGVVGANLVANTSDTASYYLPMSNSASGTWSNAVVATTLTYSPGFRSLAITGDGGSFRVGNNTVYTFLNASQVSTTAVYTSSISFPDGSSMTRYVNPIAMAIALG